MSIYLDHAATSPLQQEALTALINQLKEVGNPSSLHTFGRDTRKALEEAREKIAKFVSAAPSEIIFTSSGTESNNLAIKGLFWKSNRKVIVVSAIEHHAVLDPAKWLAEKEGAEVIEIPVSNEGVIDLDFLNNLVANRGAEIALISVMHSNNETGALQPISEVIKIAGEIPVHCDAVQSLGKVPLEFAGLTAMTINAHKLGGPIGIGALVLKRGIDIPALLHGGGQEREIRSGTLNAPLAAAFAAVLDNYPSSKINDLKSRLISGINSGIKDCIINTISNSLPGIVNVTIPGAKGETLLLLLDLEGIACSTGAACSAGVHRPSHVLMAMGRSEEIALSSIRFSIGPNNSETEIDKLLEVLPAVIEKARLAK